MEELLVGCVAELGGKAPEDIFDRSFVNCLCSPGKVGASDQKRGWQDHCQKYLRFW